MPDDAAPHSFSIDCPTAAIQLDASGRGSAVLTITNTSAATIDGRLRLAGAGATPAVDSWLKLNEPAEQRYKPNESRRFTIAIVVPPTQADGTFLFRAETYAVANPNEDFTCGPELSITVKRTVAPVHKHFPMWIPIVAVVLVLVVVGIIVAVSMSHKSGQPDPGATTQQGDPDKEPAKEPAKEPGKEPGKGPIREPIKEPVREPIKEPIKEIGPGLRRTSEIEPPTGAGAPSSGTLALQPSMGIDLATGREVASSQRADMDVIYIALASNHVLEALNGAHLARTPNATEAECESVLAHSTLASIRLDGLKPTDLIACKSRQGVYYVLDVASEPTAPAGAVDVHVTRATSSLNRPRIFEEAIPAKK